MKLTQQVALVTGAARGIGREIAYQLASNGAKVVLSDIMPDVHDTMAQFKAEGFEVSAVTGDVSKMEDAKSTVEQVLQDFGRLDILVNNAGITRDNLLLKMSEEDWDKVIAINLKGTFNLTKSSVKTMIKQRSGKIVNIASVIGQIGNSGQANYSASKAGVIAFTKSMARELGSRGIRVNAVAPGFIQSKMTEVLSEEAKNNLLKQIPLGQLGLPENVAKAVLFLVSDDADYITGQVLNVDGGMVMGG
jgi:3-oxoacyl-[acyl-carrier protein] reductase